MPSRVRTVLILLLTLGLLWFFFRNADMPRVWAEMRHARAPLLLAAVLVTGLTYVLRALRWQYLLAPIGHTHFGNAFRATVIGFAATFLLPARAGEVIRPYLLARREGLPGTAAFATIILERLLDLVTVLLLFAFFVLTADPASTSAAPAAMERVKVGGLIAAAGGVAALAVAFAAAGHPERLGRWALRIERVLAGQTGPDRRLVRRNVHPGPGGDASAAAAAGVVCAVDSALDVDCGGHLADVAGLSYYVSLRGFVPRDDHPGRRRGDADPGAVGGFHAAYQIAVQSFFGVPDDRAIGAAIVLHGVSFVPVTLLGLVFMARDGISLSRAQALAAASRPV